MRHRVRRSGKVLGWGYGGGGGAAEGPGSQWLRAARGWKAGRPLPAGGPSKAGKGLGSES